MITPTEGRIVWFYPGSWDSANMARFDTTRPFAALDPGAAA